MRNEFTKPLTLPRQTHFHCMRKDCNYRFCDKTRFVQHTARHERLDTLCGQEFEGFRGVSCQREACEFNVVNSRGKTSDIHETLFGVICDICVSFKERESYQNEEEHAKPRKEMELVGRQISHDRILRCGGGACT